MNNLYDVLEVCLQELENGADVDTVLFRHPEHAEELRPILEASVAAKRIAVPDPASAVVRRNRAKVLQHAAQLREAKSVPARRLWTVPLRRTLVSLAVIAALFISSTNLVRAASTTLPGDNLYPVKRTWEDMLVLFTFDMQVRNALEVEHENERLEELYELFTEGRSVEVDFAGLVTRQTGDLWRVAGIPVVISAQTDVRDVVAVGDAVRVRGVTQVDGSVLAERVDLLDAGTPLPEVEDDDDAPEIEQESSENENEGSDDSSGEGSGSEAPEAHTAETSETDSGHQESSIQGTVDTINGDIILVNGLTMDMSNAEIKGTPTAGANVKVEGYYDANGVFVVTKIEFLSGDSGSGSDSGSDDDNINQNSNDKESDDDNGGGGDNDNSNDNTNDNSNDNSGSDD